MIPWMSKGKKDDVAISTRIRLARNLKDEFFPSIMDEEGFNRIYLKIKQILNEKGDFEFIRIKDLPKEERQAMLEKHIVSKELLKNPYGAIAKSKDESLVVMINEEDHLRIQSLVSGFDTKKAFEKIFAFEEQLKDYFAYDEQFGYLTACPTNTGTGMRASIMLHIPALIMTNQMRNITNAVMKMGMTIRGVYGEGSESIGNIVQISNQVTLGLNEKEIIENVEAVASKIIENELSARKLIYENNKDGIEDNIFRSLGILKYARKMTSNEMMDKLSNIAFGKSLGIIDGIEYEEIYRLMMEGKPNLLKLKDNNNMDESKRDVFRANMLREALKNVG